MGQTVDARSTHDLVEFFLNGELIKTHVRKPKGKQTDPEDYPPEKIAFHMRTPTWCRKRAAEIGPSTVRVVEELLGGEHTLGRLRSAQGVLGLADKLRPAALESACAKALVTGDCSYRTIKAVLAATGSDSPDELSQRRTVRVETGGAYLRGPDALFAGFTEVTETEPEAQADVVSLRSRTRAS